MSENIIDNNVLPKNKQNPFYAISNKVSNLFAEYVVIGEPEYSYIKLEPSTAIRNYNSDSIIRTLSVLYRDINKRVFNANNKLHYQKSPKVSFYIYMESECVEFYFIVPKPHFSLFKERIIDIWSNKINIIPTDELPMFDINSTKYYMCYKKKDAMSLSCDKRNNDLLSSILNALHVLEDGDKLGVLYNFIPTNQKTWKAEYDHAIEDLKKDKLIYNMKSINSKRIMKMMLMFIVNAVDATLDAVLHSLGSKTESKKVLKDLTLAKETVTKRESIIAETQILCMSKSSDKIKEVNNCISLCSAFDILNSDNELEMNRLSEKKNNKFNIFDTKIKGVPSMKMQSRESQNLISLPAKELLEEYKFIKHTNIRETKIDKYHEKGYIHLGEIKHKNDIQNVYLCDDYNNGGSVTLALGQQGGGKTETIKNYAKCCVDNNECVIVIDYIKNCDVSNSVKKVVPRNKILEIDFSNISEVQAFCFNELIPTTKLAADHVDIANRKAQQLKTMVDALTISSGDPLPPAMQDLLISSGNIIYTDNQLASIKDIYTFLTDYNFRHNVIDKLPKSARMELDDDVNICLQNLDSKSKKGEIDGGSSNSSTVQGILSRVNLLRNDFRLKRMFNATAENNINLIDAMENKNVVFLNLPQDVFSSTYAKDTIVCFLVSRIWNACLMRGKLHDKPDMCHLIIDELFQCPTTLQMLHNTDMMLQMRKFGLRMLITGQHIKQYNVINEDLKSTGCNVLFMKGSSNSYKFFESELLPYTEEDIVNLPQYFCLCSLCNPSDHKSKFIVKLSKPI